MKKRGSRRTEGSSTTDRAFDQLVPDDLRHLSQTHWTPVDVAVRVTSLLCPTPRMRVLDVGAGIGKFCVVGAMSSVGMWCGIEQYAPLVAAARRLASALRVADRTMFLQGDALAIDWRSFDVIYLYNPFEIPLFQALDRREHEVDYRVQVARVEDRLASLPRRVRVVTLHGFGGVMPSSYELVYQERIAASGLDLVLWVQGSNSRRAVELS